MNLPHDDLVQTVPELPDHFLAAAVSAELHSSASTAESTLLLAILV